MLCEVRGSSPRVWGTRRHVGSNRHCWRFIPTRVGNTDNNGKIVRDRPVHPHACGEHNIELRSNRGETGSSPRVWGTLLIAATCAVFLRFIPTRVGNTSVSWSSSSAMSVHPHACGEHSCLFIVDSVAVGSSPRVWGTPPRNISSQLRARFIPTRVGNTIFPIADSLVRAVHPHACGEHFGMNIETSSNFGSSPRVWGTLGFGNAGFSVLRFIPTRVGNT